MMCVCHTECTLAWACRSAGGAAVCTVSALMCVFACCVRVYPGRGLCCDKGPAAPSVLCHMEPDQGCSWTERLENKWLITGSQRGSESRETNRNLQPLKTELSGSGVTDSERLGWRCISWNCIYFRSEAVNSKLCSCLKFMQMFICYISNYNR